MESKIALKECFLECVAPGQEEELQRYLSESSDDEEPKIPAQVEAMIDIYNSSDKIVQIIILSLMDKKYKKFELRKLFKVPSVKLTKHSSYENSLMVLAFLHLQNRKG